MKPNLNLKSVATLSFIALATAIAPLSSADMIKVFHIRNPGPESANDMHIAFRNTVDVNEPNNPRGTKPGREGAPSNEFDGASIDGNSINFTAGKLGAELIDDFRVRLDGSSKAGATTKNLISRVDFTKDGVVIPGQSLTAGGTRENKEEFRKNVTGFTNDEFFDFDDPAAATFNMLNPDLEVGVKYTLFNFRIYTGLDSSNFTLDRYLDDLGSATPVFSNPAFEVMPGQTVSIQIGPMVPGTYAMAMVDALRVDYGTPLDPMAFPIHFGSIDFVVPQEFAEFFPEPSALMSLAIFASVLPLRRRQP